MGILAFLFNKIAMGEIFNCTKDKPLHLLMSGLNQFEIEELKVSGFIGEKDFSLLTEMSQERGKLHILDLSDVTETDCEIYSPAADDYYYPKVGIGDDAFVNSVRLEKVILPKGIEQIGNRAFSGCTHLKDVEIPEKVNIWHMAFQNCPLLEKFYIGSKNTLDYICEDSFAGSIKHYECDFDRWPLDETGEPVCDTDFYDVFSYEGAVFLYATCWDGIDMERYPGGNDRRVYAVPDGVSLIKQYVFAGCRNLQTITFPESCSTLKEHAIADCPVLSTLIFKSKTLDGSRVCHWDLAWDNIITECPNLKDIYLYAEDPSGIDFGIFEELDNIGDIVLHVPCFCAKKYRDYEEEYVSFNDPNEKIYEKVWKNFKRIEEFDPVDL